jgi:ubiquinone/menaquinone biosynthesis C-methylase UbiE
MFSLLTRVYEATFGRLFTAWYGFGMRLTDELGLRETRRETLQKARGRTLDVGSGTGANLRLYPSEVTELVLAEPDRHMQKVLRRKLANEGPEGTQLVSARAETLPFDDDSFDSVALTMVLCTIPDPAAALAEAARVLKPGGRLLFLEHVRSEDPGFARLQDRFEKPWRFLADGCHCNRDSLAMIESSAFAVEELKRSNMPLAPLIIRPLVYGSAVAPG